MYKVGMSEHVRRWGRRGLTVVAVALGCANLLGVAAYSRGAGWNNERTILYAAEGGLMSPREALMGAALCLVGALVWFLIFAATAAPPSCRARWAFRAAWMGAVALGGLSVAAGALCGDLGGYLVVGAIVGLPIAVVAAAVRRWGMQRLRAQDQ
jgi:hypothetical protein